MSQADLDRVDRLCEHIAERHGATLTTELRSMLRDGVWAGMQEASIIVDSWAETAIPEADSREKWTKASRAVHSQLVWISKMIIQTVDKGRSKAGLPPRPEKAFEDALKKRTDLN